MKVKDIYPEVCETLMEGMKAGPQVGWNLARGFQNSASKSANRQMGLHQIQTVLNHERSNYETE